MTEPTRIAEDVAPRPMPVQGDRRCYQCRSTEDTRELVYQRSDGVWGWGMPLCPPCRVIETRRLEVHGFTRIHALNDGDACE